LLECRGFLFAVVQHDILSTTTTPYHCPFLLAVAGQAISLDGEEMAALLKNAETQYRCVCVASPKVLASLVVLPAT
jgi:hypothetical protein